MASAVNRARATSTMPQLRTGGWKMLQDECNSINQPTKTMKKCVENRYTMLCPQDGNFNQVNSHKLIYYVCIYIYMAASQNCVWSVPRCSGRMERRSFVSGLVPDLCSVIKIYAIHIISRICMFKLPTLAYSTFPLLICTTSLDTYSARFVLDG